MCGKMLTRHCVRSQGYEILAVGDGTFSKLMLDHSMFRTVQVRERGGGGLAGGDTDILYTYTRAHTQVAALRSGDTGEEDYPRRAGARASAAAGAF